METRTSDATGLLLVDKPPGVTSHDVVAIVRRVLGSRRVGHMGTLDPFATGLLVILTGRGTRLIPYIDGEPKVYEATIRFGAETDTDDATGSVVREARPPTESAVGDAIARLTGVIEQIPPAYSAKKVAGTRAYSAARRGVALDLQPSRVTIHRWEHGRLTENELTVRITCSGGTYIRALARDLGRLTDSAAHLSALRRAASGAFTVDEAFTLDQLRAGDFNLRPLRDAVPSLPTRCVGDAELVRVLHGNAIEAAEADATAAGNTVALLDDTQSLVAVAEREGAELRPKLVLRDA
jgi:tRNA pseudouridine55 synthase